ncbi:MAG: dephospho-CoA kinase [Candidatus Omnitrophica bacterium]|nr:dephospho-CoA kinase [Candidatus Omnitrophota bacterium]
MSVLGLTGNLATGKSTVLKLLKRKGAKVFNVDEKIHSHYRNKKSPVYKKVIASFPECIKAGVVLRKKLGSIVFSDKGKLKKLEKIIHPEVTKDLLKWVRQAKSDKKKIYIAEVPLLFEKKLTRHFGKVILIVVKKEVLIQRIIKKYGLSKSKALSRLSLYGSIEKKIKGSDLIVDNSLNFKRFKKEVDLLWKKIKKN